VGAPSLFEGRPTKRVGGVQLDMIEVAVASIEQEEFTVVVDAA
jgi:hypothetical protein